MEQLLRRELKTWQKAFKAQHGRDPTKRDILADAAIAGTYDTWQAVGGDAKAKCKPVSSGRSSTASSSKQRLTEGDRQDVFKTPSKRRSSVRADAVNGTSSRTPLRTPTKSSAIAAATTPGKSRNPFASPFKGTPPDTVSPARSLIEVEITPTRRSPLLDTLSRRSQFTPTKSPCHRQQFIASSPSKLRTTLEASVVLRRTPTKTARTRADNDDAALNAALVAYTPRTKARKRLRGEDVPPTPVAARRVVSGSSVGAARTDPRRIQRRLGVFGFGSNRKVQENRSVTMPSSASVFSRARSIVPGNDQDVDLRNESPSRVVRSLGRASSSAKGFRPLFASPSGNHAPQNVLDIAPRAAAAVGKRNVDQQLEDDADAIMNDDSASPVGGLFAAQVAQRRRARDSASPCKPMMGAALIKKHKVRAAIQLPSSSDMDDDEEDLPPNATYASSSPTPYHRGVDASSSPHTEVTVPSSTIRASTDRSYLSKQKAVETPISDPSRMLIAASATPPTDVVGEAEQWRKVQQVELSDEDEPASQNGIKSAVKKVISITPYQRYGTLRTASSRFTADAEFDQDESIYTLPTSTTKGEMYAVDQIHDSSDSDSTDAHTSLAGLKLSPVRHAPSTRANRAQRHHLLNSIFDPTAKRKLKTTFNPEARFGPLEPSASTPAFDSDDDLDHQHDHHSHTNPNPPIASTLDDDNDDDDWQQEVDQDFTFLDLEIELQDVA